MIEMSGLVYKDLMNMRRYLKQLLLIFVVFVFIFSFSGNNYSFVAAYGVMLSAMVVLSSMAYDEQAKWDKYALTMPLSRRSLVGAKYLLGLLTVGAGGLLSLAVVVGTALFSGGSMTEGLASVGACLCVALLMQAVLLPCLYKFGTEKARMMMIVIFLLPTLGILALSKLGLPMPEEDFWIGLLIALPFAAALGYLLSYFISVSIFRKKEL